MTPPTEYLSSATIDLYKGVLRDTVASGTVAREFASDDDSAGRYGSRRWIMCALFVWDAQRRQSPSEFLLQMKNQGLLTVEEEGLSERSERGMMSKFRLFYGGITKYTGKFNGKSTKFQCGRCHTDLSHIMKKEYQENPECLYCASTLAGATQETPSRLKSSMTRGAGVQAPTSTAQYEIINAKKKQKKDTSDSAIAANLNMSEIRRFV